MVITTVVNPQDLNTDTFSPKTELKIYIRKEQDTAKLLLSPIALATACDSTEPSVSSNIKILNEISDFRI